MRRTSLILVLLVFMFVGGNGADEHNPAREMFRLRLGMNEEAAHKRLRKLAAQQREDKGTVAADPAAGSSTILPKFIPD